MLLESITWDGTSRPAIIMGAEIFTPLRYETENDVHEVRYRLLPRKTCLRIVAEDEDTPADLADMLADLKRLGYTEVEVQLLSGSPTRGN